MTAPRFTNGSRVTITNSTPRHSVGTLIYQDDERAVVVTPKACHYCGRGPCRATALTANGHDLERFARIHPARGIPARYQYRTRPLADLGPVEEH